MIGTFKEYLNFKEINYEKRIGKTKTGCFDGV